MTTNCGYTGHEHLDKFNLIDMNGRVYDPVTAGFLSPDIVVQAIDDSRAYNSYSYCYNNPLKAVDPSGYVMMMLPEYDGYSVASTNRALSQIEMRKSGEYSQIDIWRIENGLWDEMIDGPFWDIFWESHGGKLGAANYLEEIETTLPKIKRGHNWSDIWDFSNIQKNFKQTPGWGGREYRWSATTPSGVFIDLWQDQNGTRASFRDFRIIQGSNEKTLARELLVEDLFKNNSMAFSKYKYVLQLTGYIGDTERFSYLMSIATNDWNFFYSICNSILNR
jgi:RHS repeat-associated protein